MREDRLGDYLDHIRQAATEAIAFTQGMSKQDWELDRRTQQAVIMSLIIMGEAATKIMDGHSEFTLQHNSVPWRSMRGMRNRQPRRGVGDGARGIA